MILGIEPWWPACKASAPLVVLSLWFLGKVLEDCLLEEGFQTQAFLM